MKRILTGALALVLFIGSAQAQTKQDVTPQHKHEHGMMFKQLNLTADQKAQLKSIRESQHKEMESLKDKSLTADQIKTQREELHKKYRDQIQSILTPAQKEQWQKMMAERKAKGKTDQWKKNGFAKNAGLQKQLNLTQDQKDQLAKMRADVKSQVESVRNDNSLTQDQKKEKIHSIMKDQHEKFQSVLTKDQIEKLQSLRKEHEAKNTK